MKNLKMKIVKLTCKNVIFYVKKDKEAFFEWIEKIKNIYFFDEQNDFIYLHVESFLSDESLDELIGLFYRYNIEMQQLAQFLTLENKEWFFNKKKYWFARVFGSKAKVMDAYCYA